MLYIITEDGDEKMGKIIWELFLDAFHIEGIVVPTNGDYNLIDITEETITKMKHEDYCYIALDNVVCEAVLNFKKWYNGKMKEDNELLSHLYVSDYVSIEQVILYAKNILLYLKKVNEDVDKLKRGEITEHTRRTKLANIRDIFISDNKSIYCAMQMYNDLNNTNLNIEKCFSGLLSQLTMCNGGIHIQKGTLGKCWNYDCDILNSHDDWYNCVNKCDNYLNGFYEIKLSSDRIIDIFCNNYLELTTLRDLLKNYDITLLESDYDERDRSTNTTTDKISDMSDFDDLWNINH